MAVHLMVWGTTVVFIAALLINYDRLGQKVVRYVIQLEERLRPHWLLRSEEPSYKELFGEATWDLWRTGIRFLGPALHRLFRPAAWMMTSPGILEKAEIPRGQPGDSAQIPTNFPVIWAPDRVMRDAAFLLPVVGTLGALRHYVGQWPIDVWVGAHLFVGFVATSVNFRRQLPGPALKSIWNLSRLLPLWERFYPLATVVLIAALPPVWMIVFTRYYMDYRGSDWIWLAPLAVLLSTTLAIGLYNQLYCWFERHLHNVVRRTSPPTSHTLLWGPIFTPFMRLVIRRYRRKSPKKLELEPPEILPVQDETLPFLLPVMNFIVGPVMLSAGLLYFISVAAAALTYRVATLPLRLVETMRVRLEGPTYIQFTGYVMGVAGALAAIVGLLLMNYDQLFGVALP